MINKRLRVVLAPQVMKRVTILLIHKFDFLFKFESTLAFESLNVFIGQFMKPPRLVLFVGLLLASIFLLSLDLSRVGIFFPNPPAASYELPSIFEPFFSMFEIFAFPSSIGFLVIPFFYVSSGRYYLLYCLILSRSYCSRYFMFFSNYRVASISL